MGSSPSYILTLHRRGGLWPPASTPPGQEGWRKRRVGCSIGISWNNHPVCAALVAFAAFLDRAATPPVQEGRYPHKIELNHRVFPLLHRDAAAAQGEQIIADGLNLRLHIAFKDFRKLDFAFA